MKNKPLIILILCILHLIEPFIKVAYLKLSTGLPLGDVLANISQIEGLKNILEFWFLFPIGGMALFRLRKWSYGIFMAVQIYSIQSFLFYEKYTWPYVSDRPMFTSVAIVIINLFVIGYFLLPETRRTFFDKKYRWWEPKKRHQTHIPCVVNLSSARPISNCYIKNISLSGAFIIAPDHLLNFKEIEIDFKVGDRHFELIGKIVSKHETNGLVGFGVQFKIVGPFDLLKNRSIINEIIKSEKNRANSTLQYKTE